MWRWGLGLLVAVAMVVAGVMYLRRLSPEPVPPGIPQTMAESRAARIDDLRYAVKFRIPAEKTQPVSGTLTATFNLKDARQPLAFDFAQTPDHLTAVRVGGQPLNLAITDGHVVVPARALKPGPVEVQFDFIAGDASLNRGDEFLYSLFVPARASIAMPCFDQPDLKARWTLSLDVPLAWSAVANGREAGRARTPDHLSLIFDETPPIPTYLFAFAAGKFSVETAERNGRAFRMFHRETDAAKVARNRDAIFDLHARALSWLEEYTGVPYPWGKFDIVLIPSFQFGGMEHPGAIDYNASSLLLDETATQNQLLGRANTISHETAHMWFGDYVTMRWFNDVWMKEVFANFMAAKIVNPAFPNVNHDLRFLLQNYPDAYEIDRTEGANPIRQPLANLNEAGSLYGAIIYQKAPIVMRQLEVMIGAEAFRDGLREYLRAHAFGNATWTDLVAVLDARTPVDLVAWSRAWVEEPGRPAVRTDLVVANGTIASLSFHQEDPRGRGLTWPQRLLVVLGQAGGATQTLDVTLSGSDTAVPSAAGQPAPAWILPVGGGLGYGRFDLDDATLEMLATKLADITDPLTRGAALVVAWENMLEGKLAPPRLLAELMAAVPKESNELNLQEMLFLTRTLFWRFTPADDRPDVAARFEPVLKAGLDRAKTMSLKAAWFATMRSVAMTPASVGWLEKVWRHEISIPGLPLAEPDESDLALDLAVRDVPRADEILASQLERFKNPDRKARFAFVMPALSRDAAVRERFFESLKDVNNRRHEAWVLEAARYLNHPLRAGASRKFVKPALELVREIQRTGDIFFPKRWADATLGGYQSVQTAADVRAFIDALPADYPPRLRWVLLSSADPLFRAAKLQN